jgi:opacity protein-like surface antigen
MKKIIMPLLVAGVFAIPSSAHAVTTPYVSATAGVSLLNNSEVDGEHDAIEYNTGYLISGAVGLKGDNARVEAEIGYHRNDVDRSVFIGPNGAHVDVWTFMANGYLDYNMNNSSASPYVMAGIGVADASISGGNWGASSGSTEFAWQVGAGVGIKASDKTTIDFGYRYLSPSDADFDGRKVSLASSNIIAGIRYSF